MRMLLIAIVVYSGLAAYSILAPHSQDPRYWEPDWVGKQVSQTQMPTQSPRYWAPDSVWYVSLAQGLLNHRRFSRQPEPPFRWDPYRTPGYPVLVALGIIITGHEWGVLLFSPLFAVLMVWSVVGLTHEVWKNGDTTTVAGWLAVFFPPCLGTSGYLLTDYVHGCLTVTAFYLTLVAVRRARWSHGIGAALAWSACQWVRPISELAAVLIALIAVWEARRRQQLLLGVFLVAASLLTPLYMGYRMFHDHGVFDVSLLGRLVVRHDIVSRAEAMATGQEAAAAYERNIQTDAELATRSELRNSTKDRSDVRSNFALERMGAIENLAAPIYNVEGEIIRDALKTYPGFVAIVYIKGFFFQMLWSPWGVPPGWETLLGIKVTAYLMRFAYWLLLALATVATLDGVRHGNGWALLVLWLSFLFWVVTASIGPWGGTRYRFPGDLILIPLAAYGWMVVAPKFVDYSKLLIRRGRIGFTRAEM